MLTNLDDWVGLSCHHAIYLNTIACLMEYSLVVRL